MTTSDSLIEAFHLLEKRLDIAAWWASQLQTRIHHQQRGSLKQLGQDAILEHLTWLCPSIYLLVAKTLVDLLPLVQPDDVRKAGKVIDFYYWPGYHSVLTGKRVFGETLIDGERWNLGIGVHWDPYTSSKKTKYRDSLQARWFHFLIRPRNETSVVPADIHRWICQQQEQEPSHSRVGSLTVTTDRSSVSDWSGLRDHHVLDLTPWISDSEVWGQELAKKVNDLSVGDDPNWRFPARGKVEPTWMTDLRVRMTSVWMHIALGDDTPPWLDGFIHALEQRDITRQAAAALRKARTDLAAFEKDHSSRRPRFVSWTNLSLRPSLAPVPPKLPQFDGPMRPDLGYGPWFSDIHVRKTVGSAAFLSSIPIRPVFISLVRPWISAIYGLVRNAEAAIVLYQRQFETQVATGMLEGPWFAHELTRFIDEGLPSLIRKVPKDEDDALFVLNSIRALGKLAIRHSTGVVQAHDAEQQRSQLLIPLQQLRERGELRNAFGFVAVQVEKMLGPHRRGRLESLSPYVRPQGLSVEEHQSCLLLVSEVIQSYCLHDSDNAAAQLSVTDDDSGLCIRLVGRTKVQRNPASLAFRRLNAMLRTLGTGTAEVIWDGNEKPTEYIVHVTWATPPATSSAEGDHTASATPESFVLLVKCPDRTGIVAQTTDFLFHNGANIVDLKQRVDEDAFSMRAEFTAADSTLFDTFDQHFRPLAARFQMTWRLHPRPRRQVAVFVSQESHYFSGFLTFVTKDLRCRVPLIIGQHRDAVRLAGEYGAAFQHASGVCPDLEAEHLSLLKEHDVDLIVLIPQTARPSVDFVNQFPGAIIGVRRRSRNAADGLLSGRAARVVGATCHYLMRREHDAIIEEDVIAIADRDNDQVIERRTRALERAVLERAVRWHVERRVLVEGAQPTIFR
jgi:formyltetrahydrofolate deformylase